MGKKKKITRETTLQMRVHSDEYRIIERNANALGLTISNYMRMVCLNACIEVSINTTKPE